MITQHRQTYANQLLRFIHGFYASYSVLNILNESLQPKLKGANIWPFNARGKVATG